MIAREGYSTIAFVVITGGLASVIAALTLPQWIAYIVYGVALFLLAFMLYFFRDPERETPDDPSLIVSPADGKVVQIRQVQEPIYMQEEATQISIFLSPIDVHVNRVPASGTIEYVKYHPGVYLMAWDERASSMNERADFGLLHESGTRIFFRQITGFLARRIVYDIGEAEKVRAGQRFGMMKFGSRMDILVPKGIQVDVKEGDRTVAGESIIARFSQ